MKKVLILLTLIVFSTDIIAQESCAEKLLRANSLYEKGQFTDAIEICKSCATESNSKSEQWQANRLLAITYLANDQKREARKASEKMLALNPTYKYSAIKDPQELIRLLKSVKVIPKFSMGLAATIGGNFTYPNITETYNGANYTKNYSSEGSWQAGTIIGYNLNRTISLHSGMMASSKHYSLDYKAGDWNMKASERLTYLDVPLFSRFTFLEGKKIRPFIDAGGYAGYLLSSKSDFSRVNETNNDQESSNNLNSKERRNKWEYGVLAGVGAMYKIGSLNFALDVKYYLSYANITNTDNRYKNPALFYNYYYLDDNIRLNNLAVSICVIYNVNYRVLIDK